MKEPWSSKGLLDLLITLFCAAVSSTVVICFKHYYMALVLIILFLIIAIVILGVFYTELRFKYNLMSEKSEQMIDVQKINRETYEEKLKQRNQDNFNTESVDANNKKSGLNNQDPEQHDEDH